MQKNVLIGAAVLGLLMCAGPTARAALVTFQLGAPAIVGSTASLEVSFTFALEPGENAGILDTIGLSVIGSDDLLTSAGTDYSRFSFVRDTAIDDWTAGGEFGTDGYEIFFDSNLVGLAPGDYVLGTLVVDIGGLNETSILVRIDGGGEFPGEDNTYFAGTIDDNLFEGVPDFDPGEQSIDVAPVPEPGTLAIFALGGAFSLLGLRMPKRRRV